MYAAGRSRGIAGVVQGLGLRMDKNIWSYKGTNGKENGNYNIGLNRVYRKE